MPVHVEQLGAQHAEALRALLAKDPVHNLYLLGLLEEFGAVPRSDAAGFAFWGRFDGRHLTSALFVGSAGGFVVPSASDGQTTSVLADAVANSVKLKASLGDKPAVDAVVRSLCTTRPRLSKLQRLFSVSADDLGPFTNPTLRLAREEDLPRLVPLAAGAVRETLGRDPLADDPQGFPQRVLLRIRNKRTYVLEDQGELVFKLDIGSRSQHGAELEGLYTAPAHRRRGHATLSLGQISRHLLSSLPRLTLRIDEKDEGLTAVARKVGYVAGRTQRLVMVE